MKYIKKIIICLILTFLFIPMVSAKEKVTINLFHLSTCPHCREEIKWLKTIDDEYIKINYYEVSENKELYDKVLKKLDISETGVPLTIIGSDYTIGYSNSIKSDIEDYIDLYSKNKHSDIVSLIKEDKNIKEGLELNKNIKENSDNKTIPLLGKVNIKEVSLPLVAMIIGVVDGFNPCAMWVLIFLITMLMNMKNKKRMWILGLTFLISSALVYMLFMLAWLKVAVALLKTWFQYVIAIVALGAGIFNLYNYYKTRKQENGCTVTDSKKRKRIITYIKKIVHEKSFIIAFLGIIALAFSINLLELACSAGLPVLFTQILSLNNLSGLEYMIYILIYIFFFMIDDIIVFVIAMLTLKVTGVSNKYTKYSHLVGGIIMLVIGLLMIFKMDWLMFNF